MIEKNITIVLNTFESDLNAKYKKGGKQFLQVIFLHKDDISKANVAYSLMKSGENIMKKFSIEKEYGLP
jgi:hypothetical protein